MQTVSIFNRNLVILLVSLALINIAVGFYKSFNKSKQSNTSQINYEIKKMNLIDNETSGTSIDYISGHMKCLKFSRNMIFLSIIF